MTMSISIKVASISKISAKKWWLSEFRFPRTKSEKSSENFFVGIPTVSPVCGESPPYKPQQIVNRQTVTAWQQGVKRINDTKSWAKFSFNHSSIPCMISQVKSPKFYHLPEIVYWRQQHEITINSVSSRWKVGERNRSAFENHSKNKCTC